MDRSCIHTTAWECHSTPPTEGTLTAPPAPAHAPNQFFTPPFFLQPPPSMCTFSCVTIRIIACARERYGEREGCNGKAGPWAAMIVGLSSHGHLAAPENLHAASSKELENKRNTAMPSRSDYSTGRYEPSVTIGQGLEAGLAWA